MQLPARASFVLDVLINSITQVFQNLNYIQPRVLAECFSDVKNCRNQICSTAACLPEWEFHRCQFTFW